MIKTMLLKIKLYICILLSLIMGGGFFTGLKDLVRAGDFEMIGTEHMCSFATRFTELAAYPSTDEERVSWMQGMVTGNGENGAVCSGSPYGDTLIYQNINFIMPSNDPRHTPEELPSELEQARRAVIEYDASWDVNGRNATYFYAFHPSHTLRLSSKKHVYRDYIRWTDFETAEVGVRYSDVNGSWERTTFSSREDNVTITRIKQSSLGKKIDMTVSIDDCWAMRGFGSGDEKNMRYKKLVDENADSISLIAHYPEYENSELKYGGYCGMTLVLTVGGKKERVVLPDSNDSENVAAEKNPAIKITDASEVIFITRSDRCFDMGPMAGFAGEESYTLADELFDSVSAVARKYSDDGVFDYDAALAPHAEKQSALFNTVKLDLGGGERRALANEHLIRMQRLSDELLPELVERAYNQGRYAQICCAGETFPRLYGMWTGEWNPSWRGIYTMDANVNLQASGMNTGNIREAGIGYIKFVLRQVPDWEENAEMSYGMTDAIQVPVNTDGDRAMMVEYNRWYPFQYWNAGASWMLRPIYEFRQCYGNTQIEFNGEMLDLERDILLSLLTKQANFWRQLVTPEYFTDVNGAARYEAGKTSLNDGEKYLIIPSYSPENAPLGYDSPITANATMDISAAKDGIAMTIELEKAVGSDGWENRVAELERFVSLLPDYKFDESGALCEWAMSEYRENNKHRHISHLYAAWPAFETQDDDELAKACAQAIEDRNRENEGEDDTASHGWVHKALVAARLKNADSARYSLYKLMADNIYYDSLMTDHYTHGGWGVFCTDTSIGTVGVLDEMLLYSDDGVIEALPAVSPEWKTGSVSGLRARSGAEVEIMWNEQTVTLTVTSDKARTITLSVFGGESVEADFLAGETKTVILNRRG
ncbi:MAG: glycoside hydrolase family 95 protein [Clostridia bacterium]|nr:glycoside hydrolase family 95 protein [Clostridia bacterium]